VFVVMSCWFLLVREMSDVISSYDVLSFQPSLLVRVWRFE
jgi:hypothetical protein